MSWTEDQLDKLRTAMIEAKRQGAWISAPQARVILALVETIRRLTMRVGWSGIPQGKLPTVADTKAQGVATFTVICSTSGCWTSRQFSFAELGIEDHIVFIDIPRHRRFVCRKCRGRDVRVMADWPNPLGPRQPGRTWSHQEPDR